MVLFAFGCEARVGKDTAALHLQKKFGGRILSFAAPLRDIQAYVQSRLHLPKKKERCFLQMIGDWGRNKKPTIFVDLLLDELTANRDRDAHVYVTDVRYAQEFETLRAAGFTMIRILKHGRHVSHDLQVSTHSSETSLLEAIWDFNVENNKTFEAFYATLDRLMIEAQNVDSIPPQKTPTCIF